ncbi:MAG: NAD(P)-binding domain-containing protein [Candidatus Paceibacterota bacterium]|jgi:glycerol-3-phosphate dehydrogenase (NAD(P)+)
MTEEKILIIGGGRIGSAIRHLLRSDLSHVSVLDKSPEKSVMRGSKEEILQEAGIIFLCVPSAGLPQAIKDVNEFGAKSAKVVVLTKGMMDGDVFMHEFLKENLLQDFYLLYGPMLAKEICDGGYTGASLAGPAESHNRILSLFDHEKLFLEADEDVAGTAVMGILKNVYTIMLSMVESSNLGDNFYGAMFTRIFGEAKEVVQYFNGEKATVEGFAGLGDLVATSRSSFSSNKTFGTEMVKNGTCDIPAEGWKALPALLRRLGTFEKKLPVLLSIDKICLGKESLPEKIRELLRG